MGQAVLYFLGELNDFLPHSRRGLPQPVKFEGSPAVKHLVEALGVPHPEVVCIRVGESQAVPRQEVDFSWHVQDGETFTVCPASAAPAGSGVIYALGQPAVEPRFVLDNHLGRLAAYLRMLGFDSLYRNDIQDEELAQVASQERRILLTRDRRLLMRSMVIYGYCLRSQAPAVQAVEVLQRYGLAGSVQPFRRCLRCNGPLQPVSKDQVLERLEPLTRLYYDEFHLCQECGQVYWKGSHYERMEQLVQQLTQAL